MKDGNNYISLKSLVIIIATLFVSILVLNQLLLPGIGFPYSTGMYGGVYWGNGINNLGVFLGSSVLVITKILLWLLVLVGLIVGFAVLIKKF